MEPMSLCMQTRCNAYKQETTAAKKLKVAINGFGRIGRQFLRCQHGRSESNLEIVCINDSGGPKQASHLLKYDSTFGTFDADVKVCCYKELYLDRFLTLCQIMDTSAVVRFLPVTCMMPLAVRAGTHRPAYESPYGS
jgi:hypothetical protein